LDFLLELNRQTDENIIMEISRPHGPQNHSNSGNSLKFKFNFDFASSSLIYIF